MTIILREVLLLSSLGRHDQFKCCKHTVGFRHQRRHGDYLGPRDGHGTAPDSMPFRDCM